MRMTMPDIRARLLATRLPALPQVLMKIMQACSDENVGMEELADFVAQDAALAARVLQVATSPAFHAGSHVASIRQALSTIGLDMVRTLLVTQSVYQTFHEIGRGIDLRGFWVHAITAGVTARMLAERQDYPQPDEAYLAGLLHDIGRLALTCAAPQEYAANFFAEDDAALCALEERTLEITHAEAGALLIERMSLDSFLADSIRYHHTDLSRLDGAHPLVRIIARTDQLLHLPGCDEVSKTRILAMAGLSEGDYLEHRAIVGHQVTRIAESFGIELPPPPPAQAASKAIAAVTSSVASGTAPGVNPLMDTMRDLVLVEKTLTSLRQQTDPDTGIRAIVKASIILFEFSDAIVLEQSPGGSAFTPTSFPAGRQRLTGLSLSAGSDNLVGRASQHRQAAVLVMPANTSVAEEQLLRVFQAEALVALPVLGVEDRPLVLVGATTALHAIYLEQRLALLREFGGQAGTVLGNAISGAATDADRAAASPAGTQQEFIAAARRVAHEVNNPLAIIRNYLTVLQRKADSAQPIGAELQTIEEELDRVAHIIDEFSQPSLKPGGMAACEVNAALKYTSGLFTESGALTHGVQILRHVAPQPTMAAIDQDSLRQILINLVKNAVEALPHGGRIDLRNNGVVERDGGHFVALTVSDTGPGIPDAIRARLFQPVSSTKEGSNRGLGLSIVHDIVQRNGGRIACRSSRGGTIFDILLPSIRTPDLSAAH
jgi:signal transduction histidine kinase/HD-like signal output (HDOD) protein